MLQAAYGSLTKDELNLVQARWMTARSIVAQASIENIRPFYQNETEVATNDNTGGLVWYEPAGDWVIEAFLASTFTPAAAIAYSVIIPKLRLTLRANDLGASFKVLLNGLEVLTGDSYSAITQLIDIPVDVQAFAAEHGLGDPPYDLLLQMVGAGAMLTGARYLASPMDSSPVLQVCLGDIRPDMDVIFQQSDDCTLQASYDGGVTWSVIYTAAVCAADAATSAIDAAITSGKVATNPQPSGQGSGMPGQCYDFDVVLNASGVFTFPVAVDTGDTVIVSNVGGAWADGSLGPLSPWACGDGGQYAVGACTHYLFPTNPADPAPTLAHMRLIAGVNGTNFIDAYQATFLVPSGITGGQLTFQANDTPISDDFGALTFHVQVCKAGWSFVALSGNDHTDKFVLIADRQGTGSAAPIIVDDTIASVLGVDGWFLVFNLPFASSFITYVKVVVSGNGSAGGGFLFNDDPQSSSNWVQTASAGLTLETMPNAALTSIGAAIASTPTQGNSWICSYVEVHGTGSNPFVP